MLASVVASELHASLPSRLLQAQTDGFKNYFQSAAVVENGTSARRRKRLEEIVGSLGGSLAGKPKRKHRRPPGL